MIIILQCVQLWMSPLHLDLPKHVLSDAHAMMLVAKHLMYVMNVLYLQIGLLSLGHNHIVLLPLASLKGTRDSHRELGPGTVPSSFISMPLLLRLPSVSGSYTIIEEGHFMIL